MLKQRFFLYFLALLTMAAVFVVFQVLNKKLPGKFFSLAEYNSSCVDCHGVQKGMSPWHEEVQCVSCHLGNNQEVSVDSAHRAMIRVPGNLADADATCGVCHPDPVKHINQSLMTTNSGIIAVDKFIFGEFASPDSLTHVRETKHSMADEHLRSLCLRCHVGSDKKIYGEISELSRGGGCNACHLNYGAEARGDLKQYTATGTLPQSHPSLDLNISNDHCFGCHSRSGRISLNYEGYHETLLKNEEFANKKGYRQLSDARILKYVQEDVHHERGLACIDCHGYKDVMGDGKTYVHEEDAVKISCEDCHSDNLKSKALEVTDFTQQRIFKVRDYDHLTQPLLLTTKDSTVLNNAFINDQGVARLIAKISGKEFELLAPSSSCTREFGHNNLTCTSCHTQWAPQCIGCHVTYEPEAKGYDLLAKQPMQGSWVEYAGAFLYGPPTLGVRESETTKTIEPATPGMIMTLDKSSFSGHSMPEDTSFYRLFAPASPHTIGAEGRNCTSCHNNPLALGYGRGELKLVNYEGNWQWQFTSEYEVIKDGLPADAWTGFLKEPGEFVSTRTNFRPFNVEEQKRILRVGACLTCHDNDSEVMKKTLHVDFNLYLNELSAACILVE